MSWLSDLISAITNAFTNLGSTILQFIKDGFTELFLETTTSGGVTTITGPSNLAIFMFFLIGISLVISLTVLIFRLVANRGNM